MSTRHEQLSSTLAPSRVLRGWASFCGLLLAAILIPFALFGEQLERALGHLLQTPPPAWQAGLLLGALLAGDIVLPLPSSLLNTAAGALVGFWGGLACSWTGMMVGSAVGYLLGARAGAATLRRLAGEAELARVARAAERYGHWFLLLFRGVPVLAEASVVFAGLSRMPWRRFLALCALANLAISASYAAVGARAMEAGSFLWLFAGLVLLPALALGLARRVRA
jgi:uncharacterized membrane protein YdjX (TVP38/TMEM64 family)